MMDDEDLEARLARWRPSAPPPDLLRRLRAAEPPPARGNGLRLPWLTARRGGWLQPWPLAYAGLLAAWALILVLRLLTPAGAEPASPATAAWTEAAPADAPALAGTLAAGRVFVPGRRDPDPF